jgi:NAD(P)H dehydrogenase (quinone)
MGSTSVEAGMYLKTKVTVIWESESDPTVYRLAMAAAAGAWDAGAEVRVRRVGQVTPPDDARSRPDWGDILCDGEEIPHASLDDLEWADVVLFGTSAPDGAVLGSLKDFIRSAVPLKKAGKLASKVYGVFTGLPAHRDRGETRLLSLPDVFDLWGGVVVTPGDAGAPRRSEAARDYARRAAEVAHRLGAARTLADVA